MKENEIQVPPKDLKNMVWRSCFVSCVRAIGGSIFSVRLGQFASVFLGLIFLSSSVFADTNAILVGQAAKISVTAAGTQPFTYQWYKNGVAIPAPAGTLADYVTAVATTATSVPDQYYATVTNAAGSTDSDIAYLTVNNVTPLATITKQPVAASVLTGGTATFTVTATGTGTLSYQWSKDGTAISGATSASIIISNVLLSHAGNYSVAVVNTVNSLDSPTTNSDPVALTVTTTGVGPSISTQPVGKTVVAGEAVALSVTASGTATLAYQWKKDGTSITGATTATYSIAKAASTDAGSYSVTVTNSINSVTSNAAALVVMVFTAPTPDGYASAATGGVAGTVVTPTTVTEFINYAEATAAYVINVNGALSLGSTSVKVKSNKTIQGIDGNSTIVGCLELSGGISNVVIRGLNISNPGTTIVSGAYTNGGDGITIRNASNIFITHCSFFDCADQQIEISNGADNVTVSWSDFMYSASQTVHRTSMIAGAAGSESKALRVTLHHNMWSTLCDTGMPSGTYGYVHLFNNYFKSPNGTSGSVASDAAQFLAEANSYDQIKDPLYKENVNTALAAGRIRSIGNSFSNCTGKAADAGSDTVFTPAYTYDMLPVADVVTACTGLAGNNSGAASASLTGYGATISGPTDVVATTTAFTLTSQPSGFVGTTYQWRMNNFDISGATSVSYSVQSTQAANAGVYTVVIGRSSGDFVVSAPLTIALGTPGSSSSPVAAASTGGGGGGGAPSLWYLALVAMLAVARARRKMA